MRTGVPPSSKNCLDAAGFLPLASETGAMRVPRQAAGMMTTTFIAACKFKEWGDRCSNAGLQHYGSTHGPRLWVPLLRFAEPNAIPVRIHDPGEAAVVVVFAGRI